MNHPSVEEDRKARRLRFVLAAGTPGALWECPGDQAKGLAYQPVAQLLCESIADLRSSIDEMGRRVGDAADAIRRT